jgi:hypothetical protein
MTAALMFTVPQPIEVVLPRCNQAIRNLGAPLKSDSGHYITGVISSGQNPVEIRVTWLAEAAGTQITVSASHEDVSEAELENVTLRFKYEYFHLAPPKAKVSTRKLANSILFAIGALAVIAVFIFALIKHKS